MGETGVTRGMRHPRSRQGGKPVHGFARAVWGGIGALPAWIVAVVIRGLPLVTIRIKYV